MITTYLLGVLLGIINAVFALLPTAPALPNGFNEFFVWLSNGLSTASVIIPVTDILIVVGLIVSVELAWFVYKAIQRIFNMIRGAG